MKTGGSMITKSQQFAKNSPSLSFTIGFSLKIDKKQPQRPSEIVPHLLCRHQEFLLEISGRRRTFSFKGQFEGSDDAVDDIRFYDKRDNSHLTFTGRTTKKIHLVDLADHLGFASGCHK